MTNQLDLNANHYDFNLNVAFILQVAKSLHRYGTSADRLEKALTLVSQKYQIKGEFLSIPTGLFAQFEQGENRHTSILRLEPGKINLSKLVRSDEIVDAVIADELSTNEGMEKLQAIIDESPDHGTILFSMAVSFISFTVALLLGGYLVEAVLSASFGFIFGLFVQNVKSERVDTISEGLLAAFVASSSHIIHFYWPYFRPDLVITSSLIVFIPGLLLTMAIHELSSHNLTSGTAKLMASIVILLKISFGALLGAQLAQAYFPFEHHSLFYEKVPTLIQFALIPPLAISLGITFQTHKKHFLEIIAVVLFSMTFSHFLGRILHGVDKAFVNGVFITVLSNLFSRWLQRPALLYFLPSIILLVPGSVGYKGLSFLFLKDTLNGVEALFNTTSIGLALVAGSYLGNLLIKPKRTL